MGDGGRTMKVTNSVEKDRADRLLEFFQVVSKQRKPIALLRVILQELSKVIKFHNVTIFALQPELIRVGEFVKTEVEKIKVLRSTL